MQMYDRLDQALPEFEFTRTDKGWKSGNVTKLDGREGKTKGQVVCTDRKPTLLADHSDGLYLSFWNYVQGRDNLDNGQTFRKLLELSGAEAIPYTREQLEDSKRKASAAQVWELFMDYCKEQLQKNMDEGIKQYLIDRKYTGQDLVAMELGQLTDWMQAMEYIKGRGYSEDAINEVITCNRSIIGWTHKLIIPIRYRSQIQGIIARNINWTKSDKIGKYINSTDLKKGSILHGLPYRPKNGNVVLVEGQLDAGIAAARNYQKGSVCALGGKAITEDQVRCLLDNTRSVTICLDNEPATREDIRRTIKLIQKLDEEGQIADRIYVATLPEGIKDADELITQQGIDTFTDVIDKAAAFQNYLAQDAINTYDTTDRTDKDVNDLVEAFVSIAADISSPVGKDDLLNLLTIALKDAGMPVTRDAIEQAAARVKEQRDQQDQDRLFKQLLKQATKKAEDGDTQDGIAYLEKKIRQVKSRNKKAEYDRLYNNVLTEDNVYKILQSRPKGVQIGYIMRIDNEPVKLEAPAGQLTFFAGPTNHGKTGILLNVAVNILKQQRPVHYFTFEMDAVSVLKFALNIFIGQDISKNNRNSINGYFNARTSEYIAAQHQSTFQAKKNEFFSKYLDTKLLNIHHVEYSADELIGFIEYIQRQDANAVIIIDYIQKMRSDKKGDAANRYTELKFICEDLNSCAISTQLPIILAAQFNRATQTPLDMHPTGMAEGSDIEKIASEIYGVWNCTKKLPGKTDNAVKNEIGRRYSISGTGDEPHLILEILKSRQYPSGYHSLLSYHINSGRLHQEEVQGKEKYA